MFIQEATPNPLGLSWLGRIWSVGRVLLDPILECCGDQVGGLGGPFGMYFGSCRAQVGIWEAKRQQGSVWKGSVWLRAARGPQMGPSWAQLEPSWSQLGPNMDAT